MILLQKNYFLVLTLLLSCLFFTACPDDEEMIEEPKDITTYNEDGFFIVNEGVDAIGAGSLSFYHRAYEQVVNNIYQDANNGALLGDGIRHLSIIDNKAYIVAGNSDKIIIANPTDMTKIGEINGFEQPRHITLVAPGKAYVSQWGMDGATGSIQIVDLNSNSITGSIPTRPGPDEMLRIGNNVYVANSGGIFADSLITKISILSDEILKTIEVGLAPRYLEVDKDLNLWVLTRGLIVNPGNTSENIKGKLVKIEDDVVSLSLNVRPSANSLTINLTKDKLYFIQNGWVYEHPITSTSISLVPFIERFYYGFEVDTKTGNFVGLDAKDLVQNGDLVIIDADKTPLDTVSVGVTPLRAVFQ